MSTKAGTMRTTNHEPRTTNHEPRTTNHEPRIHNHPLVSVIIPACNTASYIHRAIESSLRQTYTNIEILVIDDGSTDNTLELARSYESHDSRLHVYTQKNKGVSEARNLGIHEAKGEYLVFLDSDDWLEDDGVASLLDAQLKHPDKLIAAPHYRGYAEGSSYIRRLRLDDFLAGRSLTSEEYAKYMCTATKMDLGAPWAKMFRAECCTEFPKGISHHEDVAFVFDYMLRTGGAYCTSKPVLNFLYRVGSLTHGKRYNPVMHRGRAQAHMLMLNHPDITPAIREYVMIHAVIYAGISDTMTTEREITRSDVKEIRDIAKRYIHTYLKSSKVGLKEKLSVIYQIYPPLTVSRLMKRIYNAMKYCRALIPGRREAAETEEIIPLW